MHHHHLVVDDGGERQPAVHLLQKPQDPWAVRGLSRQKKKVTQICHANWEGDEATGPWILTERCKHNDMFKVNLDSEVKK